MNTNIWRTGFAAPFDANMRLHIPEGDAGTDCTIAAMIAVCHHAALTIGDELADAVGRHADAQRVYDFLDEEVVFKPDPDRLELVRTPEQMLAEIKRSGVTLGDCDDRATLGVAILLAIEIGTPVIVTCGMDPVGNFQHVYCGLALYEPRNPSAIADYREPPPFILGIDPQERIPFGKHPPAGRYRVYHVPPPPSNLARSN